MCRYVNLEHGESRPAKSSVDAAQNLELGLQVQVAVDLRFPFESMVRIAQGLLRQMRLQIYLSLFILLSGTAPLTVKYCYNQ